MRLHRLQVRYNLCQQYVAKGACMITDHTIETHFSPDIKLHETADIYEYCIICINDKESHAHHCLLRLGVLAGRGSQP